MGMPKGMVVQDEGGRFVGVRGLTDMERAFVQEYLVNGGKQKAAATVAGYADPSACGWHLSRSPKIQSALRVLRQRKILALATAGLAFVEATIEGTNDATMSQRLKASMWAVELAGHVAPKPGQEQPDEDKPMAEMTVSELEGVIRRGEEAIRRAQQPTIEGEAVTVEDAPSVPAVWPDSLQPVEIEEESTV